MKRRAIITAVSALVLPAITQAGITNFDVYQHDSDLTDYPNNLETTHIDLTAGGNLDWGVFGKDDSYVPTERKSGGAGFVSLVNIGGGATDTVGGFNTPQNYYTWTDGIPTASGDTIDTTFQRALMNNTGDGIRFTFDVVSAGTYQLKFYASTFNVSIDGSATLLSEGVAYTFDNLTANPDASSLDDYIYTVDFVTTGADTLTLDATSSHDTATADRVIAIEAYTLEAIPEPATLGLIGVFGAGVLFVRRRFIT